MRFLVGILFVFFNALTLFPQTFEVQTLKASGEKENRINLVFMGDGYTALELDRFITDATNLSNNLFSQSPFKEYANYFNVYAIKVPSNESGTDHPGTATDVTEPAIEVKDVDTYFNTSFDTVGIHRLLYTFDSSIVYNLLAEHLPEFDQPIILVNTSEYGGAGGSYATSSTGQSADEIVIHELGHSLFNLRDEYFSNTHAKESINMTQETNPAVVKWKNWLGENGIGIYQHSGHVNASNWYRPHQSCKMRYLGYPYCEVCKEGIVEKIHDLVSPIDSYQPQTNTIEFSGLSIEFSLQLLKPEPNTLEVTWALNNEDLANNVDTVSLADNDLNQGTNSITAVVHDNSSFLKVDNHNSGSHIYTVTWTINKKTLGMETIESSINNYNISLFPSPSNTTVTLKFESNEVENLNVEIVSMDGKRVKSIKLSNLKEKTINISNLSQGIYITNFYDSNNTRILSKKLIKK